MTEPRLKTRVVLAAATITIAGAAANHVWKLVQDLRQLRQGRGGQVAKPSSASHSEPDGTEQLDAADASTSNTSNAELQTTSTDAVPKEVREALRRTGQEHLVAEWDQLTAEQRKQLTGGIQAVDLMMVNRIFRSSQQTAGLSEEDTEPVRNVVMLAGTSQQQRQEWTQAGYKLIAEGKLALLLLAGGQGTRLGTSKPKGCFDIGLPSRKSLFQLQAERLLKLQRLAAAAVYGAKAEVRNRVRWYIMTSDATDAETQAFFQRHAYFGLQADQVVFFRQGWLPCLTEDGKIILETPESIAKAPDGNGGVYTALQRCGLQDDMETHGVECVDCFSVDNALVRAGDPYFLGHCWQTGAECGARVLAKAYPEERVGVFALRGGDVHVVEYSELSPEDATSRDADTGDLRFNWSNVCMHYFKTSFLRKVAERLHAEGRYHIAKKTIQSKDGPVKGIKLELFIFDTFPMAAKVALLEVRRDEEFAPVKNAPGAATDSPNTARKAVLALHTRWVKAAGGGIRFERGGSGTVEVSPLVSYAGEGLESICKGHTFREGYDKALQET